MYASVTKIIPDLNDQFKISGGILLLYFILLVIVFSTLFQQLIDSHLVYYFSICNSLILPIAAIVDKEKKTVEKFGLSSQEMSDFDTCNAVWKMIT